MSLSHPAGWLHRLSKRARDRQRLSRLYRTDFPILSKDRVESFDRPDRIDAKRPTIGDPVGYGQPLYMRRPSPRCGGRLAFSIFAARPCDPSPPRRKKARRERTNNNLLALSSPQARGLIDLAPVARRTPTRSGVEAPASTSCPAGRR